MCLEFDLTVSDSKNTSDVLYSAPRIIERSPKNLILEAREAFNAGLFISCLTLLVIIPDVCANLIDPKNKNGLREWCVGYLGLPGDFVVDEINRTHEQSQTCINRTMSALTRENNFTASDFCQLRNAVLHTESSVVGGAGAKYSPFHSIAIWVFENENQLVTSFGVTSSPKPDGVESHCCVRIALNLTALLARMEKGVARFLNEYPELDREYGKESYQSWGIVDFTGLKR